jgi:hypothetical protein
MLLSWIWSQFIDLSSVILRMDVLSRYLIGILVYWMMFLRQSNILLRLSLSPV